MIKKYSLYGLPDEIKFCKSCSISNQRPRSVVEFKNLNDQKKGIQFDDKGICEACNYSNTKKEINWEERESKLIKLLDKHRKNNGEYDCIVPGSGGKDSAYASHLLKYNSTRLFILLISIIWWAKRDSNSQGIATTGF